MAADVAVIIPTLRRPEGLERALRSVFAQVGSLDRIAAVVVADNDPDGSAAPLIEKLGDQAPVPLIYAHAPVPGVATARNVGLAATDAPLIAFLDDDEAASPGWLAALLDAQMQTGADVVFGPIRGRVPENTGWTTAYLERFFGRDGPGITGLTDDIHGCGNSLMVRAAALPGDAPFDVAMNETGGEDDRLFTGLMMRGGRFGWAAGAWVDEFAPPAPRHPALRPDPRLRLWPEPQSDGGRPGRLARRRQMDAGRPGSDRLLGRPVAAVRHPATPGSRPYL